MCIGASQIVFGGLVCLDVLLYSRSMFLCRLLLIDKLNAWRDGSIRNTRAWLDSFIDGMVNWLALSRPATQSFY